MRLILIANFLAISACASPYKYPCHFTVDVTVDQADRIGRECYLAGAVDDVTGRHVELSDRRNGCSWGKEGRIISTSDPKVLGHEMAHQVEAHCRK